jgi:hypothetical protein
MWRPMFPHRLYRVAPIEIGSAGDNVRNVVAAFAVTWNRHDLDAFGKLFAPDTDFVNVNGQLWTGRQSIQAQHAYVHGAIPANSPGFSEQDRPYYGIFKNITLKFDHIDVRFLRNEVAWLQKEHPADDTEDYFTAD